MGLNNRGGLKKRKSKKSSHNKIDMKITRQIKNQEEIMRTYYKRLCETLTINEKQIKKEHNDAYSQLPKTQQEYFEMIKNTFYD